MYTTVLQGIYLRINDNSYPIAQTELLNDKLQYCKAIWTLGKWIPTPAFNALMTDLRTHLGDAGIIYAANPVCTDAQLHWTLFQIQTFPVQPTPVNQNLLTEASIVRHTIGSYPALTVDFIGISKTRYGLFLCGYPSFDVNLLRNNLRNKLKDIIEPHPQDISHATLFRFTKEPTADMRTWINMTVSKYANISLLHFVPQIWEYGYGTWFQNCNSVVGTLRTPYEVLSRWYAHPRWILHRGLINGPDKNMENNETQLFKRLSEGWDIEIDIWKIGDSWWLGHDAPSNRLTNIDILIHPRVWVHCKNLQALAQCTAMLTHINSPHYFTHDSDIATLTSHQYIWAYPGHIVDSIRSICVMPERVGFNMAELTLCGGVCSDFLPNHFY